ncbi:hypothetical protein T09_10535 [Trichinella sp. T9]|uniref:Uncharacterized protein n=1 Tax=Trichinella murrelli TaxID=144512 RepID=A0A0V0TT95_9BILA|nr:hypothetical protein T05_9060 [Trichinella murrelli]KRX55649.1 hypothetical protein T09_7903 [Trichinella sp. T9]KRX55679.1 hypothetical protein T09_10535 [Trichinella sp. T9]KRZ85415.1 hypothetical protein T08_10002 [Trichinella sp. T8]
MKFGSFDEANCISPCLANYSVSCLLVDHEVLLFVDGRWQCLCFERLIENPDELWSCLSAILVHMFLLKHILQLSFFLICLPPAGTFNLAQTKHL